MELHQETAEAYTVRQLVPTEKQARLTPQETRTPGKASRNTPGLTPANPAQAKCLHLPAKCDSPVDQCRPVSLKTQQELTPRHVPDCQGADWLVVKTGLEWNAGDCGFSYAAMFPLDREKLCSSQLLKKI